MPQKLNIADPCNASHAIRATKAGKDLSHHLNASAKLRKPSPLKEMAKYMGVPGMTSLAGGMPYPDYFPFNAVEVKYQTPTSLSAPKQQTSNFRIKKYGSGADGVDLAHFLQYSAVEGTPYLLNSVKDLITHGIKPASEWDTLLTCGSTDGLSKILSIIARTGDEVLVEKYTYASFIAAAVPFGVSPVPVDIDEEGMSVEHLRQLLDEYKSAGKAMPRMMYLVTVGQNPTGTIMGSTRKQGIMAIANEYDILIIEDDPYFFLQFDLESKMYLEGNDDDDDDHEELGDDSQEEEYLLENVCPDIQDTTDSATFAVDDDFEYCMEYFKTLEPSFLKFDTEGRVFRVETFSKVIGPGMRLGTITTSPIFHDALLLLSQSSTQAPSGLSMAFASKLMFSHGLRGWCQWTAGLRHQYHLRCDHMLELLDAEFGDPKGKLVTWQRPAGGMFIWLGVNLDKLPMRHFTGSRSTKDIMFKLWVKLAEAKVLIVPGWVFAATPLIAEWKTNFFRLTYASSTMDEMDLGISIMGKVVREFFQVPTTIAKTEPLPARYTA